MLPPHAPPSFSDRSTLWNSVELYEKAGNAQLARETVSYTHLDVYKRQGKQTVKQLVGQNQGVSNIEITDPSIKEFEKIARKYGCLLYTSRCV